MIDQIKPGSKMVRFICKGPCAHHWATTEERAKQVVKDWRNKTSEFFSDPDGAWAIRASEIIVIETVDAAEFMARQQAAVQQQQGQVQMPLSFLPKKSGVA